MQGRLERDYQSGLISRLEDLFPGCVILKNDTDYQPGIPDLLILHEDRWAMLEVKASEDSSEQPNQGYYVKMFETMSFGAFIYPSNEREVLRALQRTFKARRPARLSQCK